MEQIKNGLITFLQVILWLTFITAIQDPGVWGARPVDSVFGTYAMVIDPLYQVAGWVITPVQSLFQMLGVYQPTMPDTWFPLTSAAELSQEAPDYLKAFCTPTLFQGALIWWVPLASLTLSVCSKAFDLLYDRLRNSVWNLVVEYGFHGKKAKHYKAELDKKASDLSKLDTQYKALAQETHSLKDSVITDELTALFNKRYFLSRLQQDFTLCKKEKKHFSLIMIDIDFFKKLNDTYGHLVGDNVLKGVATVIKRVTPAQCHPCRYGGEEFSVILPGKNKEDAVNCARQIQEQVQLLRFNEIDPNLRLSVSQGVCSVNFALPENQSVKEFDDVLQLADQELYRSKMEGRNRVSSKVL